MTERLQRTGKGKLKMIIICRDRWGVTKAKTSSETGYKYACFGLLRRLGFSFDQVTFTISQDQSICCTDSVSSGGFNQMLPDLFCLCQCSRNKHEGVITLLIDSRSLPSVSPWGEREGTATRRRYPHTKKIARPPRVTKKFLIEDFLKMSNVEKLLYILQQTED